MLSLNSEIKTGLFRDSIIYVLIKIWSRKTKRNYGHLNSEKSISLIIRHHSNCFYNKIELIIVTWQMSGLYTGATCQLLAAAPSSIPRLNRDDRIDLTTRAACQQSSWLLLARDALCEFSQFASGDDPDSGPCGIPDICFPVASAATWEQENPEIKHGSHLDPNTWSGKFMNIKNKYLGTNLSPEHFMFGEFSSTSDFRSGMRPDWLYVWKNNRPQIKTLTGVWFFSPRQI